MAKSEEHEKPEEHVKLAAAALAATAPNPKEWVQKVQMWIAFGVLVAAFGLAGLLVLHGPPAPKAASGEVTEKTESVSGGKTTETETTRSGVVGVPIKTPAAASTGEGEGEGEAAAGTTEASSSGGGSEEGESLANLSKQGPWAFAIVALLVGVFLATGKSMTVGGPRSGDGSKKA